MVDMHSTTAGNNYMMVAVVGCSSIMVEIVLAGTLVLTEPCMSLVVVVSSLVLVVVVRAYTVVVAAPCSMSAVVEFCSKMLWVLRMNNPVANSSSKDLALELVQNIQVGCNSRLAVTGCKRVVSNNNHRLVANSI